LPRRRSGVVLDGESARQVARALLTEAYEGGKALVMRFRNGRFVGYGVVPDPAFRSEKKRWDEMAFEGNRRGRAVQVATGKNENGKIYVAVLCELAPGSEEGCGARYTWKGWCTSPDNVARTIKTLRTLGWTGTKFTELSRGKLEGIGSREVLFVFKVETNPNTGRSYSTIAFINPIADIRVEGDVSAEAAALDKDFAAVTATEHDEETGEVRDPFPASYGGADA